MRPSTTEVLTKEQLHALISALEGVLRNLPDSNHSPIPKEKVSAVKGAFLQDWRLLSASSRYCRDRVGAHCCTCQDAQIAHVSIFVM